MLLQVVHETPEGTTIFPHGLPHPRGSSPENWRFVIIIFAFCISAISAYLTDVCARDLYLIFSFTSVGFIVGELLNRFGYFLSEMAHINGRYDGRTYLLFEQLCAFTASSKAFLLIVLASVVMTDVGVLNEYWKVRPWHFILIIGLIYNIQKCISLDKNPVHMSITLESIQPLDYGSGMAENFFYGFLRLCLPDTGDQEKGIKERINDYIAHHKLDDEEFPVKKLFILIPASTYIPNSLEEHAGNCMQPAGSLEPQEKNRAGVIGRKYKNSVYRIQEPGDKRPLYVVVEGATPCKTLQEAIKFSGVEQAFFQQHQKDIVLMFYKHLSEVINRHDNCRDLCELIYYVDTDERGHSSVNVASLIKKRVREVQAREAYLERMRRQVVYST